MGTFQNEEYSIYPYILPVTFLLSPLLSNAVGMETFLEIMLAVFCLYLYSRNYLIAASLICSLATLARPDVMLLAVVLVIYDYLRNKRFPSLPMMVSYLLPIIGWLIFSYLYFGSLFPSSLVAKISQTSSGRWGSGLLFLNGIGSPIMWTSEVIRNCTAVLFAFGLMLAIVNYHRWHAITNPVFQIVQIWTVVYLMVYGLVLQPPNYFWYYTQLSLALSLVVAVYIDAFYRLLTLDMNLPRLIVIGLLSGFIVAASIQLPLEYIQKPVTAKYEIYKLAAEWLNENTEKGSSVGANEIGVIRYYYHNGPVIDGLGLTTPDVSQHVKEGDYSWYVKNYRPDFLLFNYPHRPILESMVEDSWFQDQYLLRKTIQTPRRAVAIYQRID